MAAAVAVTGGLDHHHQSHPSNGEGQLPSHSSYSLRHRHQSAIVDGLPGVITNHELLSLPLGGAGVGMGDNTRIIQPASIAPYQARADKEEICSKRDGQAMYHCHHCTYTSLRFQHMEKHYYAKHAAVKPFNCRYCPHRFPTKERRDNHERSKHTLEKPYRCRFCSRGYPAYSQLHTHIRLKHANVRHVQQASGQSH